MTNEHVRTKLRKKLAIIIGTHAETADVATHVHRRRPVGMKGPGRAIEILTPRQISAAFGSGRNAPEYQRTITVELVGYVSTAGEGADDSADLLELELELALSAALEADPTLDGLVVDGALQSTDFALDAGAYQNAAFAQSWEFITTMKRAAMVAA